MKKFYKEMDETKIVIKNDDSFHAIFFQCGIAGALLSFLSLSTFTITGLIIGESIDIILIKILSHTTPYGLITGLIPCTITNLIGRLMMTTILYIIPIGALTASLFFKPTFVTLRRDEKKVYFLSSKANFSVPYSEVQFRTSRMPTGKGVSFVVVTIVAVSDKPLFPNQKMVSKTSDSSPLHATPLCSYTAGSQELADDTIEFIQAFMDYREPEFKALENIPNPQKGQYDSKWDRL